MGLQPFSLHPLLVGLGFHNGQLNPNPALLSHQGDDTPRYKTPPSPRCKSRLGLYYRTSRELSPSPTVGRAKQPCPRWGAGRSLPKRRPNEVNACKERLSASHPRALLHCRSHPAQPGAPEGRPRRRQAQRLRAARLSRDAGVGAQRESRRRGVF